MSGLARLNSFLSSCDRARDPLTLLTSFEQHAFNGPLRSCRCFKGIYYFGYNRGRDQLVLRKASDRSIACPEGLDRFLAGLMSAVPSSEPVPGPVRQAFRDLDLMVYPLVVKSRPFGCLAISFHSRIPKRIENDVGLAVLLKTLKDELYIINLFGLVVRDDLTGLHNKRFLYDTLGRLMADAARGARTVSLAMIDIDRFKHYNDTYGHPAGDYLLKSVARTLQEFCSSREIQSYRYGGEEMILVFPDSDCGEAAASTEKLRQIVEEKDFSTPDYFFKIRISCGVADSSQAATPAQLIERADHALYHSKENGRNRVTVYPV